ncbi:MAG: hypothetical protein GY832_31540 [Chloroflexi bacterium]|nr:hypothetical protein [Chloroflexota bacterium]
MIRKILQTVMALLLVAALVAGVGCAALSEYATPAPIDSRAVEYVIDAGLADANDYDGYANLHKARKLEVQVTAAHEINMLELEQMIEQERLDASILRGIMERSVSEAVALEEAIFDPVTGVLAAGLGVFGLSAGGLLGLFRTKPGDFTPTQMQAAVADLNIEVGAKERQFMEVVKQVQQFKDSAKRTGDPRMAEAVTMLSSFLRSQSKDTAAAVAVAKNA